MGRLLPVLGVLLAMVLFSERAAGTELYSDCQQLSSGQSDELDARLKLLLHASSYAPPRRIEVRCFGEDVRVTVVGERTAHEHVDTSAGLVDGVLDAVERVVTRRAEPAGESTTPQSAATPPVEPHATAPERTGDAQPALPTPAVPPATQPEPERRDAGGLGVGLTSEYAFAPIGTLIGPRLDLAVGSGPYAASLTETVRFSSARGRGVLDFDVLAGFGFGAPYVSTHDFGGHLGVGVEWLSAGVDRTRLTDSSPVVEVSVRMAWQLGRVALWASLDVRARLQTLELAEPIDARLARVATLISIGGVVLADAGGGD